jgi:hypothetical protein
MKRFNSLSILGVALTLVLAQCAPSCAPDPGYPLRHDFSLSPGVAAGLLTSCVRRASDVEGRQDFCRVVYGHEESGDSQNWHLDLAPSQDDAHVAHVIASRGSNDDQFGIAIVLDNDTQYEGCRWTSPTNDYDCDYAVADDFIMRTGGWWDYVLHKAWNWSINLGETIGCASAIVGIWYGGRVTLPALISCADGPM